MNPQLRDDLRRELDATTTATERAALLDELVRQVYDFVKREVDEGIGLDGHDGPERHGLGTVTSAAIDHRDATLRRQAVAEGRMSEHRWPSGRRAGG